MPLGEIGQKLQGVGGHAAVAWSSTNNTAPNISAGTTSGNIGSLVFSNSNGVSFGLNGSTITANVAAQPVAFSGSNGSSAFTTLSFGNSNGLSYYISGGSLVGSYTVPTQSNQSVGFYASSNTTQGSSGTFDARSMSIVGAGAVSVGYTNGSVVVSAAAGAQSVQTVGVYAAGGNTTGQSSSSTYDARTLEFIGAGIISVGNSGGSIYISSPGTTSITLLSVGMSNIGNTVGTTGIASNQLVIAGGSNITLSGSTNAGSMTITVIGGAGGGGGGGVNFGVSTMGNKAGSTGTVSTGHVYRGGSGAISLSQSTGAAGSAATITINAPAQSSLSVTGNLSLSINGSTISLGVANQTVGFYASSNTTQSSSGTFDARSMSIVGAGAVSVGYTNGSVLISGPPVSSLYSGGAISLSTAGLSVTISAPVTSSVVGTGFVSVATAGSTISIGVPGTTASVWMAPFLGSQVAGAIGNGIVQLFPALCGVNFSATKAEIYASMSMSTSSNSSWAGTLSAAVGIYTRNGSTLSLASNASTSFAFTNTSNNSTGSLQGFRAIAIPFNANAGPNDYWIAVLSQTSSANANWYTLSPIVYSNQVGAFSGPFGGSSASTNQSFLGMGQFTATTNALPGSIAFSNIVGTNATQQLVPAVMFNAVTA